MGWIGCAQRLASTGSGTCSRRSDGKEQKRNGKGLERELWMVFSLKRLQNSSDSNELIYSLSSKSKHKVQNG